MQSILWLIFVFVYGYPCISELLIFLARIEQLDFFSTRTKLQVAYVSVCVQKSMQSGLAPNINGKYCVVLMAF